LVLSAKPAARAIAVLDIAFEPQAARATAIADAGLEALRSSVPAARSLPLLAALARLRGEAVVLEYVAGAHLRVTVSACA
jgi:hypothetical protein